MKKTLKFSDGMQFDLSGELRIERRRDGLYVVGKGMLMPVRSEQEGREAIEMVSKNNKQLP